MKRIHFLFIGALFVALVPLKAEATPLAEALIAGTEEVEMVTLVEGKVAPEPFRNTAIRGVGIIQRGGRQLKDWAEKCSRFSERARKAGARVLVEHVNQMGETFHRDMSEALEMTEALVGLDGLVVGERIKYTTNLEPEREWRSRIPAKSIIGERIMRIQDERRLTIDTFVSAEFTCSAFLDFKAAFDHIHTEILDTVDFLLRRYPFSVTGGERKSILEEAGWVPVQ